MIELEKVGEVFGCNSACLLKTCNLISFANCPEFSTLLVFSMIVTCRLSTNEEGNWGIHHEVLLRLIISPFVDLLISE